ncbi:MAG: M15 family metallopeptidase [Acidobacteria bacterium]|nr:M15 family metallopeptidase [Acidobacteriota bacterium]
MTTVREYAITRAADGSCTTAGVQPLNDQIFELAVPVLMNDLVSCEDIVEIVGSSTIPFLQPAARAALAEAVAEMDERPRLVHAYRTLAHQYVLFFWFNHNQLCDISLAATPGSSPHEQGIAIDIRENARWRAVLARHNWRWRGSVDPAHFTYIGPGTTSRVRKESIRAFQRLWNIHNPADLIQEDGVYGDIETGPRIERSPVEGFASD